MHKFKYFDKVVIIDDLFYEYTIFTVIGYKLLEDKTYSYLLKNGPIEMLIHESHLRKYE